MLARRGLCLGCVTVLLAAVVAIALFVRWWTAPIDLPRPQRPPEPADNPYDVYRSLAIYTAQAFQSDYMLAYAERELSPSRMQMQLHHPELARYLLRKMTPVRLEYRRYLRQPCMVIMEYTPDWRFSELAEFRRWAVVEAIDISLAAQEGDYARAVDNYQTILLLSEQIRQQGAALHYIVGAAMQSIVTIQMARILSQLPAPECERLVQVVREWQKHRVPPTQAVAVERDAYLSLLHDLHEGKPEALRIFAEERSIARWYPRWLNLRRAAQEGDAYYRQMQEEIAKPRNAQRKLPQPQHLVAQRWGVTDLHTLSRLSAHATGRVLMLGCAAGVRAYRLRHGAYPPSLSAAGVDDLNRDPFTGEQFLYKPAANGFLLYSVGRDGVDDGGKRAPEQQDERGDVALLPFYRRHPYADTTLGDPFWLK
ncbi:MAG: hypothetical protein NZ741_04810 [Armatimonadetes bacterium]|nr:hypothetical protein [Armatimonadota bacterium]